MRLLKNFIEKNKITFTEEMSNKDLINTQKFFKKFLNKEMKNYNENFNLKLFNYDLDDYDIYQLNNIIDYSNYLTEVGIRLSNTIENENHLNKLFKKLKNIKNIKSLSLYVKYFPDNLLNILYDFLGNFNNNIINFKIKIKYKTKEKENEICFNILENLNKNNFLNFNILDLSEFRLDSLETYNQLDIFLKKCQINELIFGNKIIYNNTFNINISKNVEKLKITNTQLNFINFLPISDLNLSFNNIGYKGAEIISNLISKTTTLIKLNLQNNYLGDEGITLLCYGIEKNNSIQSLNLSYNNILDYGVTNLAKSLLINNSIKKLNLYNNNIGNDGIKNFCEILSEKPSDKFIKLKINSNLISEEGVINYSNFLINHKSNTILTLHGKLNEENQKNVLINFSFSNNLKTLDFYNASLYSSNMTYFNNILMNNKNIKKINLTNVCNLSEDAFMEILPGIENNKFITDIILSQCKLSDDCFEGLFNCLINNDNIECLHLDYNKINIKGIKILSENILIKKSLKLLNLGHNSLNNECMKFLGDNIGRAEGIQKLYLNSNKILDEGCRLLYFGLERNHTLNELNIENNQITNIGIKYICNAIKNNIYNYTFLNICSNQITEIESELFDLFTWLEYIKIADNPLSKNGIMQLFKATEKNRLFKKMRFTTKDININYTFNATNKYIKEYDLSYGKINISLIKSIISLNNLTTLILQETDINDILISNILKYINNMPKNSLKKLLLLNNKITYVGAEEISKFLESNKCNLTELNLSGNPLQYKGINLICNSLINNNTLNILFLNFTKFNDYSSETIYKLLIKNKSIKIFSILSNYLSNKGIDIILSSLKINSNLIQFSIGDNKNDERAFKNLKKYLYFNNTLKVLEIKTSKLENIINKIYKIFYINKTLVYINLVNNMINYEGMKRISLNTYKSNNIKEIKLILNTVTTDERKNIMSSNPHFIIC